MHSRRRAFTLLEVVIASIVFMIVIVASLELLTTTDKTVGASLKVTDVVLQADRLAGRIREELSQATNLTLNKTFSKVPEPTSPFINYWTTVAYDKIDKTTTIDPTTGQPDVSTAKKRQLRFRYDEAPDNASPTSAPYGNGIDDDNDGLIDEGVLELWEGSPTPTLVATLAHNVSSAWEQYEPTPSPWLLYPSTAGMRGGPVYFQFTNDTAQYPTQVQGGMRGITFEFTLVTRLPVTSTKNGAPVATIHQETRHVSIAFRTTSN